MTLRSLSRQDVQIPEMSDLAFRVAFEVPIHAVKEPELHHLEKLSSESLSISRTNTWTCSLIRTIGFVQAGFRLINAGEILV